MLVDKQEQGRRRDFCHAILREQRKHHSMVEGYIAEAEHQDGHRYWSDNFYNDDTFIFQLDKLLEDFDIYVQIVTEAEVEAVNLAAFEAVVPQHSPEPPYALKVETTVFTGPGKAEVEIITLRGKNVEYLHEELLASLAWADEKLLFPGATELMLVPMADDYVIVESVGGIADSIAGVIKVYAIDASVCPG